MKRWIIAEEITIRFRQKNKAARSGSFISLSKELDRLTQRRLHIIHIRHCLHRSPFLVGQHMSIGIQRKSNRIMPQQDRERFRIHTLLHCTGRKGMPQCMKVVVRQIGRSQHLLIILTHEARLDIEAVLLRSNQTAFKVGSTHCGGILHLYGSPILEIHH